jgi:hypothetical protein
MDSSQPQAQECQWAPAVRVDDVCTGVYVGGLLLTAAHCLSEADGGWNINGSNKIGFGEVLDAAGWDQADLDFRTRETLSCVPYPGGYYIKSAFEKLYIGVDLAFCHLNTGWSGSPIPVMVPGCESEYLSNGLSGGAPPRMFSIGMGCDTSDNPCPNLDNGHKRYWETLLNPDAPQMFSDGSLKLHSKDKQTHHGDSGGPLFVEMQDGTWRLIGVLHGGGSGAYWEPVPSYLRWIETRSGTDITPCHYWNPGEGRYIFDNSSLDCTSEVGFALNPELPGQTSWLLQCVGPEGGGDDTCAGWNPSEIGDVLFPPGENPENPLPPRLSAEPGDTASSCPFGTERVLGTTAEDEFSTAESGLCLVLNDGDDSVIL